jgi:GWxTD domain-containing protein
MKLRSVIAFFSCAALLLLCTCRSGIPAVSRQNQAGFYDPQAELLRADFVMHNESPATSRLFFRVNASQLLYTRPLNSTVYSAKLLLSYILHPRNSHTTVADSGHVVLTDEGTPGESKLLSGSIAMRIRQPGQYTVEVSLRDLNKMTVRSELLFLDQETKDAAQQFLLTEPGSSVPLFRAYSDTGELLQLRCPEGEKRIQVRRYPAVSGPAAPPFLITAAPETAKPDSSWWLNTDSLLLFRATRTGRYSFHTSESSKSGFVLNCVLRGYPQIRKVQQLIEPLRYLTPREEFAKLTADTAPKKAVDKFWLDRAGSEERAREVIRRFYQRVEQTNVLFTTDREGWQTDRGMIYLIFGQPQSVYRFPAYEVWYYGNDSGNSNTLSFTFMLNTENGVTDFLLERNLSYKINWLAAVDAWRQGQVYTAR